MFAVRTPSADIPVPSRRLIRAAGLTLGWNSPLPSLGERVMLLLPDEYRTNMFAPAIAAPWPRPSHCMPEGATICINIEPSPDCAVDDGMFTEKETPFAYDS
jgi:hypothetical protein